MLTTLSCETCFNEKSVINYFGRYVMIQRESTSLTFFFSDTPCPCFVLFHSFNLFCGRNRSDEIKHISRHTESYGNS